MWALDRSRPQRGDECSRARLERLESAHAGVEGEVPSSESRSRSCRCSSVSLRISFSEHGKVRRKTESMANITEEHLHHMAKRHHATMKKLDGLREKFSGMTERFVGTVEIGAGAWLGGAVEGRTAGGTVLKVPINLGVGALLARGGSPRPRGCAVERSPQQPRQRLHRQSTSRPPATPSASAGRRPASCSAVAVIRGARRTARSLRRCHGDLSRGADGRHRVSGCSRLPRRSRPASRSFTGSHDPALTRRL